MTYSKDFREQALKIKKQEKLTYEEPAQRFGVSSASLVRWNKRLAPQTSRNKPATKLDMDALKQDIDQYPDAYQQERAQRLKVSTRCIQHALKRLKVTYKKTLIHPKACAEKRSAFCQTIEKHQQEGSTMIFLDESGFAHENL